MTEASAPRACATSEITVLATAETAPAVRTASRMPRLVDRWATEALVAMRPRNMRLHVVGSLGVVDDSGRWLSAEEQATWRSYPMSHQLLMRALDQQLRRDSGLAHTDYALLVQLSEQDADTARITELAMVMDHSQSRMSHAVARLERAGCAASRTRPTAGWSMSGSRQPGGRHCGAAAPGHVRCVRESLFDGLSAEQLATFRAVCSTMLDRLSGDRATENKATENKATENKATETKATENTSR